MMRYEIAGMQFFFRKEHGFNCIFQTLTQQDKKTTMVKYRYTLSAVLISFLFINCNMNKDAIVNHVNPFICTEGDHGQWHPGAMKPFGMVKIGPDTYPSSLTGDGDLAHSGYNYADEQIRGFSLVRPRECSGGTSVRDRAGYISFLPATGSRHFEWLEKRIDIDKESEFASAGHYGVRLNKDDILTEMTSTKHCGFFKFIYPGTDSACIFIDAGNSCKTREINIFVRNDQEISGWLELETGNLFFIALFNTPFQDHHTYNVSLPVKNERSQKKLSVLRCDFKTSDLKEVLIKVGVSAVSMEGAQQNLETEIPHWKFNEILSQSRKEWKSVLDRIQVKGSQEYKEIFYTALYHSFSLPTTITDVTALYPGLDRECHEAYRYTHYDNFAFWDSFRTKYPLYTLISPQVTEGICRSILDIYNQVDNYLPSPDSDHVPYCLGFMAKGKNGYVPYETCRHEHMLTVVVDAVTKSIGKLDAEKFYNGMRHEVLTQMPEAYDSIGYIPKRPDQTVEYAYDNYCIAKIARVLGKKQDYEKFKNRADFYKNTWDKKLRFFRARSQEGKWLDFPADPRVIRNKYTCCGSKWHWRWFVLHDIPGLIGLFGGKQAFVKELEYFFSKNLYNAGSQPDIHAPFLFNYANAPWLTQKWVRKLLTEPVTQLYGTHGFCPQPINDRLFKNTPDGYLLEMDDDYGTMAAWYVLSSMGLYQVCPGQPIYQLTAPIFDSVVLKLDPHYYTGNKFIIEAHNLSEKNIYIQSALLDSVPYKNSWISHDRIVRGGRLVYEMGPEPNKAWFDKVEDSLLGSTSDLILSGK